MTTQFAPAIQKPEDSFFGTFSDAIRSEYREMDSGPPSDLGEAILFFLETYPNLSPPSQTDIVFYSLVKATNSILSLDIRYLIQRWQELPFPDNPVDSFSTVALRAVEYIKTQLRMSEITVARLVGVSRNTIRNWRNGQGVYPSTTRKLFQVKHLLSALNSVMTQDQMSVWLNGADDDDPLLTRLDRLAQPDGPALVAQQASFLLFPMPPGNLPLPAALRRELERIELDEKGWVEYEDAPHQFSARPRRQRPGQGSKR